MRLFFALWPSPEQQTHFRETVQGQGLRFSGRWIERENLHLTLLFLPSVSEEQIGSLYSLVERPLLPRILLRFDRLLFQPAGKEGLLWLAPPDGHPALARLVESLHERLLALDILAKQGRPLSPHMTLARRVVLEHRPEGGRGRPTLLHRLVPPIDWSVREMALLSSETLPEGSRYTPLASWALPGAA